MMGSDGVAHQDVVNVFDSESAFNCKSSNPMFLPKETYSDSQGSSHPPLKRPQSAASFVKSPLSGHPSSRRARSCSKLCHLSKPVRPTMDIPSHYESSNPLIPSILGQQNKENHHANCPVPQHSSQNASKPLLVDSLHAKLERVSDLKQKSQQALLLATKMTTESAVLGPESLSSCSSCKPSNPMSPLNVDRQHKPISSLSCPELIGSLARARLHTRFAKEVPQPLSPISRRNVSRPQSAAGLRNVSRPGSAATARSRPTSASTWASKRQQLDAKYVFTRVPDKVIQTYIPSATPDTHLEPISELSPQGLSRRVQYCEQKLQENTWKQRKILLDLNPQLAERKIKKVKAGRSVPSSTLPASGQIAIAGASSNNIDGDNLSLQIHTDSVQINTDSVMSSESFHPSSTSEDATKSPRDPKLLQTSFSSLSCMKRSISPPSLSSPESFGRQSLRRASINLQGEDFKQAEHAFNEFSRMSEISCDDLVLALRQMGYRHPMPSKIEVENVVIAKFGEFGGSFLDREEYFRVVSLYHDKYWGDLRQMLRSVSRDDSGKLCKDDVASFLRRWNITPTQKLLSDLMQEIAGVDGEVSLKEFVLLLDIIHDRKGFSLSETEQIKAAFQEYADEAKRDANVTLLCILLQQLGLIVERRVVKELTLQVQAEDTNPTSALREHEFMLLVRKCHEHKLMEISSAMKKVSQDKDNSDGIPMDSLDEFFQNLGCTVSPEVLVELAIACNANPEKDLCFDDVHQLVEAFEDTQGFLKEEREEIQEAFRKFEKELTHAGGISGIELAGAVRWLGYPATERSVKDIILERHIGHHFGSIDFLSVLGKCRVQQLTAIRSFFEGHNDTASLSTGEMRDILTHLGYNTANEVWEPFVESMGGEEAFPLVMDMWELDSLVTSFRCETRDRLQAHEGFSDSEAKSFEEMFRAHDKNCTGMISRAPLRAIIDKLLPQIGMGVKESKDEYKMAQAILRECDKDGNKQIDLDEFMHMMRLIRDHTQKQQLIDGRAKFKKERLAIRAASFSFEEVLEFRKVFETNENESCGGIHPSDLEDMIAKLLFGKTNADSNDSEDHQFNEIFKKLMHSVSKDLNHSLDQALDFPEFLYVMRKVLDIAPGYNVKAEHSKNY